MIRARLQMSRSAIIDWYYGIYNAAQAMLIAQDKTVADKHSVVSKNWYHNIVKKGFVTRPFSLLNVDTLVKKDYEQKVKNYPYYQIHDNRKPTNDWKSYAACYSYLVGTAKRLREQEELKIKNQYNINEFKTKKNKQIRDEHLRKKYVVSSI